ncbi:MAG TPA: hypothetical protein VGI55_10240 [Solirubrobacteraceae bacterium]
MNTPKPDCLQLRVECRQLALLEQLTRDHAGRETAEHEIKPELVGERREREDEHEDHADGELRARLQGRGEERKSALGRAQSDDRHHYGGQHERDQNQAIVQGALRRKNQRQE